MSDKEQRDIFSRNLVALLDEFGIQQVDFAKTMGFNHKTVNGWCKGLSIPTMGKVQAIADYFHVGKTDLLDAHSGSSSRMYSLDNEAAAIASDYMKLDSADQNKVRGFMDALLLDEKYQKKTAAV